MKRIFFIMLVFALVLSSIPSSILNVNAYEFPNEFWSVNEKYIKARQAGDHYGIIEYGTQIINIMQAAPDGFEKRDNIVTRYHQVGLSYAELGDYSSAYRTFLSLYNYAKPYEHEFYDYVRGAKARILQYETDIRMFVDGGNSSDYGAKNEIPNGVLFGICANGGTRSKIGNESIVLTYQELGQDLLAYNEGVVRNASRDGIAVEFALNCPKEAYNIENITRYDSYLKDISNLFKQYPDVPVYLRFAAEFDTWSDLTDADSFIYAFRYVSDYFKKRNSNVAIVWSPNKTSNWYINTDDYYPGDEYVDWVGVSLYIEPYYLNDTNDMKTSEIVYKTGINSDPVVAMKHIIETYGDRKPVMISESGVGHKLIKSGVDTSEFAIEKINEFYGYLPMVYPQIKAILYFDWYVESNNEKNDFRLSTNSKLQNEYIKLTKGRRFIQDKYSNSAATCYREVRDGIRVNGVFEVGCYAHVYDKQPKSVTYFIDGEYAGLSTEVPFNTYIDAQRYDGYHTLKANILFDDGTVKTTESDILINGESYDIEVRISGKQIDFDKQPVLYNSRTMVPMRAIFENLGATVTWDEATQTATGKRGDRVVRITVGNNKMYVNSKVYELDTAPIVMSGRTLVPVRAVAEGLGCEVEWNDRKKRVSITPKVFEWSQWMTQLPDSVDTDMYYVESRDEYRYREREMEYYTLDYQLSYKRYDDVETTYGSWSDWQNEYIASSDTVQVETRTQSTPKKYLFGHYCTGKISDKENRYYTKSYHWHDECKYHELGWFDEKLPLSPDSDSDYAYYLNGERYKCENTCFRWYIIDTEGGDYTQYRSRKIYKEYTYSEWGDWSRWSDWDEDDPYDYYDWYDSDVDVDVDERTVYRYKEK